MYLKYSSLNFNQSINQLIKPLSIHLGGLLAGQCHLNTQLAHRMGYIFDNMLSMCVDNTMLLAYVSPLVVIAIVSIRSSSKDRSLLEIFSDLAHFIFLFLPQVKTPIDRHITMHFSNLDDLLQILILVIKGMDVNKHERLSKFSLRHN